MKKEKFWTVISVAVLVVICIVVFLKSFTFESENVEGDYLTYPTITDEYVDELYAFLDGYSSSVTGTMYTGMYIKHHNLSYSVIMAMGYNYLVKFDEGKIESIGNVEQQNPVEGEDVVGEVKVPIYKFSEADLLSAITAVFGADVKFNLGDFVYEEDQVLYDIKYNSTEKMFYVYQNENKSNVIVYHGITKYAVTNNGNNVVIYDYYLKCSLETSRCYNDEKMQEINSSYRVVNGEVDLTDQSSLKVYSHTFVYNKKDYNWVSSELGK